MGRDDGVDVGTRGGIVRGERAGRRTEESVRKGWTVGGRVEMRETCAGQQGERYLHTIGVPIVFLGKVLAHIL